MTVRERYLAVQDFAGVKGIGTAEVIAAVLVCLKDEKEELTMISRAHAIEILPEFVEKSDADAVATDLSRSAVVLAELDYRRWFCFWQKQNHLRHIRELLFGRRYFITKAIRALAQLANKGNSGVIGVVLGLLKGEGVDEAMFSELFTEDIPPDEAKIRIEALAQLAEEGNAGVIAAVSALKDKSWKQKPALMDEWKPVRAAAVRALAQLVKKGNADEVNAEALVCLDDEDPDPRVRDAGVEALAQLAEKGDVNNYNTVIDAVCIRLKNASCFVRQAGIAALLELAPKGNTKVIGAVLDCLGDGQYWVRETAIRALAQLTEKGNMKVIAAISAKKNVDEEEDPFVRKAAVEAMAQLELA